MATHVKFKFQKLEKDFSVHALFTGEWTLCGVAFEGSTSGGSDETLNQCFVKTKEKIDCADCLARIEFCKKIKNSELGIPF